MVQTCGSKCLKLMVFSTNLVLCLVGLVIMSLSIYAAVKAKTPLDEVHNAVKTRDVTVVNGTATEDNANDDMKHVDLKGYTAAIWVQIGFGGFVFFIGGLGCCGALHESSALLMFYAVVISLLMAAELGTAIFIVVRKSTFEKHMEDAIVELHDTDAQTFATLQTWFDCCGVNGTDGWNCTSTSMGVNCLDRSRSFFNDAFVVFAAVAGALLGIELLSVGFACCLSRTVHNDNKYI